MSVHTVLLDYSVEPAHIKNDKQIIGYFTRIENILRDYLPNFKMIHSSKSDENTTKIYSCDMGGLISLRIFDNGLITINIEYFKGDDQKPLVSFDREREISIKIENDIGPIRKVQVYPPIKRINEKHIRFYPTGDERLLEYDVDDVVFEERSPFQKISIMHSKSLGNMLVLDDLQNISEADLVYTETIMQRGKEQYKDKEICILGGGDGALLYELLKENPKMVYVLEIDDIVMKACNKYMRSICGDVLEKREGPNYQIIVGDCLNTIDKFLEENRKFDYVFGDLTDVPICGDQNSLSDQDYENNIEKNELWTFFRTCLDKTFKVLKPTGKYMTHGNGLNCQAELKTFENYLLKIRPSVKFTKCTEFIPSFMEYWIFYQIGFKSET